VILPNDSTALQFMDSLVGGGVTSDGNWKLSLSFDLMGTRVLNDTVYVVKAPLVLLATESGPALKDSS